MIKTSRRDFLKVSTLAGGGFMLTISTSGIAKILQSDATASTSALNNFLKIDSLGNITFVLTKHEMGQGSGTGLPMILADELGANWDKLSIVRSDYDSKFSGREMGTTGGSGSIRGMWPILRNAGATAREMLKQAAANQWNVDVSSLKVDNNYVINPTTNDQLEFGELAEAAAALEVPTEVELKKPEEFKYIGQPVKNLITKDVVVGKANYGINVDIEGMVYASIEKCPVYLGKLKSFDDSEARKVTGVLDVFEMPALKTEGDDLHVPAGVVVVATSTWSAFKARKKLRIEWDYEGRNQNSLEKLLEEFEAKTNETFDPGYAHGNLSALKSNPDIEEITATYDNPYEAHALMEPLNATAHFKGDSCEIWTPTQNAGDVCQNVASVLGLEVDQITTHVQNSGGSFGRRGKDEPCEAAYISQQIKKPVKLTWSREDEIAHDHFHPYQRSIHSAYINKNNTVEGWGLKLLRTDTYASGAEIYELPYYFPHVETAFKPIDSIVHTGAWRSVAQHSSSLGKECFIDELAIKLKKDPIEFRLELLDFEVKLEDYKIDESLTGDALEQQKNFAELVRGFRAMIQERYIAVLKEIKEKGWYKKPTEKGKGIGIAIEHFSRTVCAHVAEVTMDDKATSGFVVDRVRSVVHCGTVVNPHFGRGQIEGSIIFALSAVHYGGVEIERGRVKRDNFHDNRLLRIDEVPEMDVHFISSGEPPMGLGEPGTPPLAPAILNAIYDASGIRVRKIPVLKKDLVKTGLA